MITSFAPGNTTDLGAVVLQYLLTALYQGRAYPLSMLFSRSSSTVKQRIEDLKELQNKNDDSYDVIFVAMGEARVQVLA